MKTPLQGTAMIKIVKIIFTIILVNIITPAFSQIEKDAQSKVRESFEIFFRTNDISSINTDSLSILNKKLFNIVKKSPKRNEKLDRLIYYQEHKKSQPDLSDVVNSPIFIEAAIGDEVDFTQVIAWNNVAMDISAKDHTALPPGNIIDFHPFEQVGPARTSRSMAIVHIAIIEAINAIYRKYDSYNNLQNKIFISTGLPTNIQPKQVSIRHAIAYAAYSSLVSLYPEKKQILDLALLNNITLIQVNDNAARNGERIGRAAGAAIIELRKNDRSTLPDPYPIGQIYPNTNPELWHKDPLNDNPDVALGANWKYVKTFVLDKPEQFRPSPPPAFDSDAFKIAYKEVFELGGDSNAGQAKSSNNERRQPTQTIRTKEQTFIGKYWAYDGTALLCAPPRLYNMIATSLALKEKRESFNGPLSSLELARYLALINIAMADAAIAAWEAKYYYLYPRPVTAIREMTFITNISTVGNNIKFWTPLGAPVTNARPGSVNFTPPFPSYPSGHATFGGALFETLRKFYNTNDIKFTFISDEYNGLNSDPGETTPRPLIPLTFNNLSDPERQNADSRIYLGIHWKFDADAGIIQGNKIGSLVFENTYKKIQ